VSDQDGPEGNGLEDLGPWNCRMMLRLRLSAQRTVDHLPLLGADEALLVGIVLDQDDPQYHPDAAETTHYIEHRFPVQFGGYNSGHKDGERSARRSAHIDDGGHDHALGGGSPGGDHHVHGRERGSSTDAFKDSHQDQAAVMQFSKRRSQQCAHHIDGHREEHHPFGGEVLGHVGKGNL